MSTIAAALRAAPRNAPFLHHGEETISFGELDERSDRVAAGLAERGVGKGDRVSVALPNGPAWLELFFGAMKLGAIVVTLNPRYREAELRHMLSHSGTSLAVTDAETAVHYRDMGVAVCTEIPYGTAAAPESEVGPDDPAVILYTSGTTGRPKGAVLTNRGILASAAAQAAHFGYGSEVIVGNMPFNHVGGLTCTIATALLTGSAVVLLPAFSAEAALSAISRHRATIFGGVPTMYVMMLSHPGFATFDVASVRMCIAGGSNVEPALCERIMAGFPKGRVLNLYGLSESSGACVLSRPDDDVAAVSSTIGVVIGDFEARIEDAVDGIGELQVRGACVAAGYWGQDAPDTFLPGGWLATGDLGSMDAAGRIALKGRRKEMYIQGGYNVYPVEVENVLVTHPAVAMAAGVGLPDPWLGEIGHYSVVLRPGASATAEELLEYCGARVADYKVPKRLEIVDDLPLTPAGKIQKSVLKERLS
ncbi:class I adenylate-forming enzyme family protein [Nonomuraea sp. NPDC050536]|uniref:class I adenylate-forming enzyme family protein n=1 Tax=Nonomuraea sp. NPDC050536 TaxID=3364366 RepID=UPI0037CAE83F